MNGAGGDGRQRRLLAVTRPFKGVYGLLVHTRRQIVNLLLQARGVGCNLRNAKGENSCPGRNLPFCLVFDCYVFVATFVMIDPVPEKNNPQGKLSLKQFRVEILKMSQREFAEVIGVSRNTVARYEMGLHKTLRFTIEQICEIEKLLQSHGLTFQNLRSMDD
ncbi:MAG: helix-turn-helix transcriptional regulator [Coleofasciculus sp. G3-WIS-01]|uniref:helix-turn-helix transcriptional regulator n=1 Tax=Coleofasciculus sp. G3-WIS-01 TaxID=3069528 RepID=UPI003302C940